MLNAFGIRLGIPLAREIKATFETDYNDFREYVDVVIDEPMSYVSTALCESITPIVKKTWKSLTRKHKPFSRFYPILANQALSHCDDRNFRNTYNWPFSAVLYAKKPVFQRWDTYNCPFFAGFVLVNQNCNGDVSFMKL